ncbi:MAG: hypothetical protein ACOCXG_03915 [Nanoarchaeota archaeon]
MYKSKKAEVPVIKFIIILLILSVMLIWYIFILFQANNISIEQKEIRIQEVQKIIFDKKCFSNEYGVINSIQFTQENLNKCMQNLENVFFELSIKEKKLSYGLEEEFQRRSRLCTLKTESQRCANLKLPVTYTDQLGNSESTIFSIDIIATN